MLFLFALLVWQTPRDLVQTNPEDQIAFLPEARNERFSLDLSSSPSDRRFGVIAESLRKSFKLNLMVDASANVEIRGNFEEVTVNDFLSYVVKANGLAWFKVGDIYHFYKAAEDLSVLEVNHDQATDRLSIEVKGAGVQRVCRALTKALGKNVVPPTGLNQNLSRYLVDMPVDTALQLLFEPLGYKVTDLGEYYLVAPMEVVEETTQSADTPIPRVPLRELEYLNGAFHGNLKAASLSEAVTGLAVRADKSVRFLDDPGPGEVTLFLDGADFDSALNLLFLGTAQSYKALDGIYLIGAKNRPELTTSQLVIVKHMNAQNVLAYLTGDRQLFQSYALPNRPGNFGSENRNRFGDRFSSVNAAGASGLDAGATPARSSGSSSRGPLSGGGGGGGRAGGGADSGALRTTLEISKGVSAEITLVREHNALMITATMDVIEEIRNRLNMIDKPVPQVLIQALVIDFNTDAMDSFGLDVTGGEFSYFPGLDVTTEGNRDTDGRFRITRLPSNFAVRVQALAQAGKARIISKPHIATLSGHEAYIEVGRTESFLLSSELLVGNENPTTRTSQHIETVEANISLRVIPWVTQAGEITTYIEPVFNSFLGQVENNVPPPISTRLLQSTIRLKDGETIILGGLIEETLRKNSQGIPGLSRIPILGNLFKNQSREYQQSELVIYLTPYVYYGNEGSAQIITHDQGLKYPLDVRKQKETIKKKKRRWWRRKRRDLGTPDLDR